MNSIPRIALLIWLATVTLAIGRLTAEPPKPAQLPGDSGSNSKPIPASDGKVARPQAPATHLKLSVRPSSSESADAFRLYVTFENVGEHDTVLNLGIMLANGKLQSPSAVRLTLADTEGQVRELHFSDRRYAGIAGRVDPFIVPLPAGAAYTLKLDLQDYCSSIPNEFRIKLKANEYRISAKFTGEGAPHLNGDVEGLKFMPFWTSEVESEKVRFRISK